MVLKEPINSNVIEGIGISLDDIEEVISKRGTATG
jgi:hypothetical protein